MFDFDVDKLIAVARPLAEAFVPGAPAAIAAADALLDLAKHVRPMLTSTKQEQLDAGLRPLLGKMNVDVDQAIADLGGTGR